MEPADRQRLWAQDVQLLPRGTVSVQPQPRSLKRKRDVVPAVPIEIANGNASRRQAMELGPGRRIEQLPHPERWTEIDHEITLHGAVEIAGGDMRRCRRMNRRPRGVVAIAPQSEARKLCDNWRERVRQRGVMAGSYAPVSGFITRSNSLINRSTSVRQRAALREIPFRLARRRMLSGSSSA